MENIIYTMQAKAKFETEWAAFKADKSIDRYSKVVGESVFNFLLHFIEEEPLFAEVFFKTKRTVKDILFEMFKGFKEQMISDIDLYRSVMELYFPGCEVAMHMSLELPKGIPADEYLDKITEYPKKAEPKPFTPPVFTPPAPKTAEQIAADKRAAEERKLKELEDKRRKADEDRGQIFLFDM